MHISIALFYTINNRKENVLKEKDIPLENNLKIINNENKYLF